MDFLHLAMRLDNKPPHGPFRLVTLRGENTGAAGNGVTENVKKYVEVSSDSKMFNAYLVSVGTSHSRKKHLVRFCASSNKISSF